MELQVPQGMEFLGVRRVKPRIRIPHNTKRF